MEHSLIVADNRKTRLLDALEDITDYAAMVKGSMTALQEAGLSQLGAEAVLLNLLNIPGYESDDWDDED